MAGGTGGFASRLLPAIFSMMPMSNVSRCRLAHLMVFAAACALGACAGGGTPREPRPAPPPREAAEPPAGPLGAPWVVSRTGARVSQTITVDATVEARTFMADSLAQAHADTVRSELSATWSLPRPEYPRRFAGIVTNYQVREADDSLRALPGLMLPIPFTAEQSAPAWQPTFLTPDASSCRNPAAVVLHGVRDLWLSLPDTLRPGQTWRDSTSHVVCRDSIPLRTDVARTFRVTSALLRDGALIVTIERRTSTTFEGAGTQFGEPVTITGAGEGAMMFEVALADGAVVFASGDSELLVTLTGRRKRQDIVQRSRISILGR